MEIYGYIRVSTKEQKDDRQRISLESFEISEKNLYIDKQSGRDFNRPAYQRLVKRLRAGDLLVVKSIDRLGRNYEEIIAQWKKITKELGADICIVDMPLLDTRRDKDLLGTFISDLVLQVLSFVSQTEREFIHQRQAEGIAAAKARGVKFGRPIAEPSTDLRQVADVWRDKKLTAGQSAAMLHISRRTFYNYLKKL